MRREFDEIQLKARKKRTIISAIIIVVVIPLTIFAGDYFWEGRNYLAVSFLVLAATMVPFFIVYEKRKPKAREIVAIAMMSALTVCSSLVCYMTTPFSPGTAMVIISGIAFGPEAGFLTGALARLTYNMFAGQGMFTPWQMFCWGIIGFLAGLIFNKVNINAIKSRNFQIVQGPVLGVVIAVVVALMGHFMSGGLNQNEMVVFYCLVGFLIAAAVAVLLLALKSKDFASLIGFSIVLATSVIIAYLVRNIGNSATFLGWKLYAFGGIGLILGLIVQRKRLPVDDITLMLFGFMTTFVIYGGVMNIASMVMASYQPASDVTISFESLALLYISGVPYDFVHALGTAFFLFVFGEKMIRKLERVKIKYGFYR